MTYEAPENPEELIIKPRNPGRPKLPKYSDYVDPVMRLFVQIRTRMEKSKTVTPAEVKAWLIQVKMLEVCGYEMKVKDFEDPKVEDVLAMFKAPETEKKLEEPKAEDIAAFDGSL